MKRLAFSTIAFFSLLTMASAGQVTRTIEIVSDLNHQSGKLGAYKALVIGIDDYQDKEIPDLKTAVKDAEEVANILTDKYGFQVEILIDRKATRKSIYQSLRKLAAEAKEDDSVLIYYAGHGELDRIFNDGWWVPSDAKGGDSLTYLDNTLVQKTMRSTKARHVLLIADSCYSGTLFGKSRALPAVITEKFYLNKYNEQSRWGMTSGNKEPVSDRGTGGHSIFAYQLLKELRRNEKPYITPREIYTRIAPIIGNNSEQTPLCAPIRNTGDQGGEFVFVSTDREGNGEDKAEKLEDELERLKAQRKKEESQTKKLASRLKEEELRRKIAEEKLKAEVVRREKEETENLLLKLAAVGKSEDGSVEVYTPDDKSGNIRHDSYMPRRIREIDRWSEDPEYTALPAAEKQAILENYFDKNLADSDFQKLPEEERVATRNNFTSYYMPPEAPTPPPEKPQQPAEVTDEQVNHALMRYKKMLEKDPRKKDIYISMGNLCYDSDRYQQAVDYYQKALDIDPGLTDAHVDMGTMYRKLREPTKAVKVLHEAISRNPSHPVARLNLGIILKFDLYDYPLATSAFQGFLKIAPDHPQAKLAKQFIEEMKPMLDKETEQKTEMKSE